MQDHYSPLSHLESGGTGVFLAAFAGLALAGICAAAFMVTRGAEQEERQMLASMQGRADVLIWALEGSARSFGHMRQNPMLGLVEEVAKQPGVAYIALVAADGRILIHSRPGWWGRFCTARRNCKSCMWATLPKPF